MGAAAVLCRGRAAGNTVAAHHQTPPLSEAVSKVRGLRRSGAGRSASGGEGRENSRSTAGARSEVPLGASVNDAAIAWRVDAVGGHDVVRCTDLGSDGLEAGENGGPCAIHSAAQPASL